MNATKQRPRPRTRRLPRPLTVHEAEAERSRAGRGAFYTLVVFLVLLVVLGVNWAGIVDFVRDAIRKGAKEAHQEHILDEERKRTNR